MGFDEDRKFLLEFSLIVLAIGAGLTVFYLSGINGNENALKPMAEIVAKFHPDKNIELNKLTEDLRTAFVIALTYNFLGFIPFFLCLIAILLFPENGNWKYAFNLIKHGLVISLILFGITLLVLVASAINLDFKAVWALIILLFIVYFSAIFPSIKSKAKSIEKEKNGLPQDIKTTNKPINFDIKNFFIFVVIFFSFYILHALIFGNLNLSLFDLRFWVVILGLFVENFYILIMPVAYTFISLIAILFLFKQLESTTLSSKHFFNRWIYQGYLGLFFKLILVYIGTQVVLVVFYLTTFGLIEGIYLNYIPYFSLSTILLYRFFTKINSKISEQIRWTIAGLVVFVFLYAFIQGKVPRPDAIPFVMNSALLTAIFFDILILETPIIEKLKDISQKSVFSKYLKF